MNPQLLAMCKTPVQYKRKTGTANVYGDPTTAAQAQLLAHVTSKRGASNTSQGLVTDIKTVFYTETELVQGDLVWLPENDENNDDEAQVVRNVFVRYDEHGSIDHYEVYL